MASTLIPILLLAMFSTQANSICVHTPPLEFNAAAAAGVVGAPTACTGYLEVNNGIRMCGYIGSAAAERACWEMQLNQVLLHGLNTKNYRCNSGEHVTAISGTATDEYWVLLLGQINWNCDVGSPDCFLDCHTDILNGANPGVSGHLTAAECIDLFDTTIQCADIDECKEGVFHDCVSGFDHECMIGRACGNNTACTNAVGSYSCDCLDGFDGDPYDMKDGCLDINECLTEPCTGVLEHCHNTIGSYVCECPPHYVWNDAPATPVCEASRCTNVPDLPNAAESASGDAGPGIEDTYTCAMGYEPSYAEDYGIHIECRGDDYCHCSSPSCVRKSCGVPAMEANAKTIENGGLHGDVLTFTCHPGFTYPPGPADEYDITCTDGDWGDPAARCANINECAVAIAMNTPVCPADSDCIDTIGSYHCDCHPGYEGPDCTRISCGRIPKVNNAQRVSHVTEEDSEYEMIVQYDCEEGYRASTVNAPVYELSFTITCKLDRSWDHRPIPECVPIFCGDPGTVAYSTRYGDSFYYWEEVSYTCDSGFRPSLQTDGDDRQFRVRCDSDQTWINGAVTCINVNECDKLTKPCGVGEGHHCIDTDGSYTCSCAPRHRLDHTGRNCVPSSPVDIPPSEPCEVYNALGFCHQGKCYVDDRNTPRCRCNEGYEGTFCNEDDRINLTIPYILAVLALSVIGFCIVVLIILSCYVCAKHFNEEDHCPPETCAPTPPPVYAHTPPQQPQYLPVHHHVPQQQAPPGYQVKYIAKQVPVNGANPVAALPQLGIYQ